MESKSLAAKDCFIAPVLNVNAERLFLDLGGYDCFPSFRLGSFNVQWPSAITSAFDVVAGCINENNKLSCLAFEVAKQIPFLDRFTSDCTDRNQIFSCVASNIKSSLPIIGDCESFGCIASEITQEIPFVGTWVEACSEESNVILCMGNRFLQDVPIFQAVQEFFVEIKDCVLERSAVDLVSAGGVVAFGCLFERMAQDIPVLSTTAEMLGRVTDCISSNTSPVTIFAGGAISWGCFIYEVVQAVPFMKNVFDMLNPCNEGENVWDCVVRFVGEIPPFNYLKKVLEAGKDFIPFVITKTVELFLNVVQFLDPLENSLSLVQENHSKKSPLVHYDDGQARPAVLCKAVLCSPDKSPKKGYSTCLPCARIVSFLQKAAKSPLTGVSHRKMGGSAPRSRAKAAKTWNPVSFWKQRAGHPDASDDPGLFSFDFGLNGEVERTELITQFGGKEDHTLSCLGYAPKHANLESGVQPEDWKETKPDEFIELTPFAMPCGLDYYQDTTKTKDWQGFAPFTRVFAVEKCMTFNQQFNFGSFSLGVAALGDWKFELPEPNIAFEVGLCFPWSGNQVLGLLSQLELAITVVAVEVIRFTWRWNDFTDGNDFRFQASELKSTFIWPDVLEGNLRGGAGPRGTPIVLQQKAEEKKAEEAPKSTTNSSSRAPRPPRSAGMWQRDLTFRSLRMENSSTPVVDQVYRNSQALKKLGHKTRRKASLRQHTNATSGTTIPLLAFDSDSVLPGLATPQPRCPPPQQTEEY